MKSKYYDGTQLLSQKDLSGQTPEIYICSSNRSAGKTTYFNRLMINRFKRKNEKFCLLYRYTYELDDCSDKFFKDIKNLFFPDDIMRSEKKAKGIYAELYLNDVSCGYAIAINKADAIKKMSHFFSDVKSILFDEFQSETGNYCPNEIIKFQSIHTSLARGNGEMSRYLPVYMLSNPISMLNPYYTALNISPRLNAKTKFLRGKGWVLEQGYNDIAKQAHEKSLFLNAFEDSRYSAYNKEGIYLNDTSSFIEKINGRSFYRLTLRYKGKNYAIREYPDIGIVYCSDNADDYFPIKISTTTDDHQPNYLMLQRNEFLLNDLRKLFTTGSVRFKNLPCKEAFLSAVGYY